jgi:hypothetical protein
VTHYELYGIKVYRGSPATGTYADMEGGLEREMEEGHKKEGVGAPWALLYLWNLSLSLVSGRGGRVEKQRLVVALAVYLLVVHGLLVSKWACCSASTSLPPPHF